MRLTIRVKPKSKQPSVTAQTDGSLVVAVHAAPVDGQANDAVIRAVARHLRVAPSRVRIVRGWHNRNKVVVVEAAGLTPRS